jgi:hypothetical protein
MIRHELVLDREASIVRRAGAGYAAGLDAWLGADMPAGGGSGGTAVGGIADWTAPSLPVELAYDTAEQGLPSGVRAVMQEGSRRLMFETGDYEVLLRVVSLRLAERHELYGQLLYEGLPLAGAAVRLDRDGPRSTVVTDQTGGFRLPPLARGAYGLRVAVAGAVLTIPPISLG